MLPRRPRWKDFDYLGKYLYFLTFCTHDRRCVFTRDDIVSTTWSQILRAAGECCFHISAHVAMPDHVHLLVEGTLVECDLWRFAALAKQYSAWAYKCQEGGRLWQPSYYDHVLRDEESELCFIRYIIENPVRAGLVQRPEDYPYLGTGAVPVIEMIRILNEAGVPVWEPPTDPHKIRAVGSG
jgi:putative transposase